MAMKPDLSDQMIKFMNFRIAQEEFSSRLYLAMSVWLNFKGYVGAAKVWSKYSSEEATHAQWAYTYLLDLNVLPVIPQLAAPPSDFGGLPQIIVASKKHEQKVTNQCQKLAAGAQSIGDYMTLELAQRYLKEQVEELAKTQYWIDRLEAFGTDPIALRLLDNEMGDSD
jgi:ferritin